MVLAQIENPEPLPSDVIYLTGNGLIEASSNFITLDPGDGKTIHLVSFKMACDDEFETHMWIKDDSDVLAIILFQSPKGVRFHFPPLGLPYGDPGDTIYFRNGAAWDLIASWLLAYRCV